MPISCYGANITCTGNFDAAIIYAFITLLVFVYIFLVIDMVTKSHLWYMYSTFTLKVIFTYNIIHKSWQITT